MQKIIPWDVQMVAPPVDESPLGLESLQASLTQGPGNVRAPSFKPVNIIVDHGVYYATFYIDEITLKNEIGQKVAIWLASLRDTDHIHLTVTSLLDGIPFYAMNDLLAAFASTKAKIDIHLDQIVFDNLGYFYLLADTITQGVAGALFLPSYVTQREQDMSSTWRAQHDFYKWIVDHAVERNLLTKEEADKLHRGSHVTIPKDRFKREV